MKARHFLNNTALLSSQPKKHVQSGEQLNAGAYFGHYNCQNKHLHLFYNAFIRGEIQNFDDFEERYSLQGSQFKKFMLGRTNNSYLTTPERYRYAIRFWIYLTERSKPINPLFRETLMVL